MTQEMFDAIIEYQIKHCCEVLGKKNIEYDCEFSRFHTFDIAAELQGIGRKKALAGMMAKHTVSIYDMCFDDNPHSVAQWEEKITDHINYLLILRAMIAEENDVRSADHTESTNLVN